MLLLLIYTYVPGGRRTLRSQLPGTIFATAGWLIFSRVFSFYIAHFWRRSYIYGSLTAVILLILWLYVIINLLFIGAGLNAELLPKGFSPGEKLSQNGRMRGGLSAAAHSRAIMETPPLIRLRSGPQTPSPRGKLPKQNAPSQTRGGAFYIRFTA